MHASQRNCPVVYSTRHLQTTENNRFRFCGFMATICISPLRALLWLIPTVSCILAGLERMSCGMCWCDCSPNRVLTFLKSSSTIQDAQDLREAGLAPVMFFYFDFKDAQSRRHAACCLPFLSNFASDLILSAVFSLPSIRNTIVVPDSQ